MKAVKMMNGLVIDAIRLNCSISRGLTEYIRSCPDLIPAGFLPQSAPNHSGMNGMSSPMNMNSTPIKTFTIPPRPGMGMGMPYHNGSNHSGSAGGGGGWGEGPSGGFPPQQQFAFPQQPQQQQSFLQRQLQPFQFPVSGQPMNMNTDWRDRMDFQPGPLASASNNNNFGSQLSSGNDFYIPGGPRPLVQQQQQQQQQPLGRSQPVSAYPNPNPASFYASLEMPSFNGSSLEEDGNSSMVINNNIDNVATINNNSTAFLPSNEENSFF
jgi:hypothetical protein